MLRNERNHAGNEWDEVYVFNSRMLDQSTAPRLWYGFELSCCGGSLKSTMETGIKDIWATLHELEIL